jgi:uncharacterized membrane protein
MVAYTATSVLALAGYAGEAVGKTMRETFGTRLENLLASLTPERLLLTFGLIFGLAFLVVTPPFQVTDEYVHFYRAFQVSEGQWVGANALLPISLMDLAASVSRGIQFHPENKQRLGDLRAQWGKPLNVEERAVVDFRSTALYSPIPYLPQSLGIAIGRVWGVSPLVLFYLGRLFNLICWISLSYLAIRTTPVFKWVFLLLALTPMSVFLAASVSVDALTNALSFLLIASFLYLSVGKISVIERKDIICLIVISVLLALSKQAYVLLLGLYLLIPVGKLGSWKRYFLTGLALFSFTIFAAGAWSWGVKDLYAPNPRPGMAVVPKDQILYIWNNPLQFKDLLWTTVTGQVGTWVNTFTGVLGWLDTRLPDPIYLSYPIILVFAALTDGTKDKLLTLKNKLLIALVVVLSMFVVLTSGYILWTIVGSTSVEGIQGRYFIPVVPLMLLLLYNRKGVAASHKAKLMLALYSAVVLTVTSFVLVSRYYVL